MAHPHDTDETLHAHDVAERPAVRAFEVGGQLLAGRYRLLELLGAGGMGTVYRARDTELDEDVALKMLRREYVDAPGALERFRSELRLARRVTHRGVARAYDIGDHDGERFLTMQFVHGVPLSRRIEQGPGLPLAEALPLAIEIVDALRAAHDAGVVHRDLKPDNVLVTPDGHAVLTDFGVARLVDGGDSRATHAGMMVGTPAYMAPEQVEAGVVDGRTDLYAFGIVLFEMLSGALPFTADTPLAMAAQRLTQPPRDLAAVAPAVPPALVNIVRTCLERDPRARPSDAAALAAALSTIRPAPMPALRTPDPPPAVPGVCLRLAVVPFRCIGDSEDSWLGDAVAEDLIDALSMTRGLRVRARTGARLEGESPADFGRRHDVDVVVDGSVRKQGDRVRVTLRLVSTSDGFQLWADRTDAGVEELLGVCDRGAVAIAAALAGATLASPPRATTAPPEAIALYLRAKREANALDFSDQSIHLIEGAVALAPDDPAILATYALIAARRTMGSTNEAELIEKASRAAERARVIAPHLPESHLALARTQAVRRDFAAAVRSLLEARRIVQGDAEIEQLLGRLIVDADLLGPAREHLERALWSDPEHHFARVDLLRIDAFEGNRSSTRAHLAHLLRMSPAHHAIAACRISLWFREFIAYDQEAAPNAWLQLMYRMTRSAIQEGVVHPEDHATAVDLRSKMGRDATMLPISYQLIAEVAGYVGDRDTCVRSVEGAVQAGLADIAWLTRAPTLTAARRLPQWSGFDATVRARAEVVRIAYERG